MILPLGVFILALLSACDKGDKVRPEDKKRVDPVLDVKVTFEDGSGNFTTKQTKPFGNNIVIDFPFYYPEESQQPIDISRMKVDIKFNEGIEVLTTIPAVVDLRNPLTINIVNADGTREDVVIVGEVQKSTQAMITRFSLPGVSIDGVVLDLTNIIGIGYGAQDLNNQVPLIEVSAGATISPAPSVPQNFNNPVQYTVTAQDGTMQTYTTQAYSLNDNIFEIHRGINVASWLSVPKYNGAQREAFFTEADVELLAQHGFDHIRLNVDEVVLWDEQGNKIRQYGFDLLHKAIQWGIKHNVKVIVDLHVTRNHRFTTPGANTLFTDPAEPAKFVKLWEDFSEELIDYPNSMVAYELLNEPIARVVAPKWNEISALAISAIRAREADRTIIVGAYSEDIGGTFYVRYGGLMLPSTHRIMATFHYYGPFLLTYFGAQSTTEGRTDIRIQYPVYANEAPYQLVHEDDIQKLPADWRSTGENVYNIDELRSLPRMGQGFAMGTRLGVPVYVGEFGTWNVTPEPSRTNWYRDVVTICEENNAPYASFDYKGFGYSIFNETPNLTPR